jgi:3-hydroxyacyl-[acyl-carrier-protein] dehydratase
LRFFLIDRVRELHIGERIVALKNVTMESAYFDQHFPGHPILPGVLGMEAMAQASGYLISRTVWEREQRRILPLFTGVARARFVRAIRPGDQLVIEARLQLLERSLATTQVSGRVDGELALRAELSFGLREYHGEPEFEAVVQQGEALRRIIEGPWDGRLQE